MREGFQVTKAPSVVNTRTPSLNPVYTGTGCELDCTKAEVMTAMKQKYQSANIEGFQGQGRSPRGRSNRGLFSSLFATFSEAFQDVADGGDPAAVSEEVVVSEEVAVEEAPADQGTADWNTAAEEEVAAEETPVVTEDAPTSSVVKSTNMKKVNRVLKLGIDKCEYEVVYDSTDTDSNGNTTAVNDAVGYFTAIFTKDATGCSFSPSQVMKSTKPIITTVPNTKTANIAFSF
jgi:putative sterol carrier protein